MYSIETFNFDVLVYSLKIQLKILILKIHTFFVDNFLLY
ncbi:hypothetical protein LLB_1878 [Legionella longbeachae D-4968]|nr:hypothetical protein LLB_1878 [Legionella longbeachae D-4968]